MLSIKYCDILIMHLFNIMVSPTPSTPLQRYKALPIHITLKNRHVSKLLNTF